MNNVSWGTREVTERKSSEQMEAVKKAMKKSFFGELFKTRRILGFFIWLKNVSFSSGKIFGGDSDGIDLKMRNLFNSHMDENSDMKKVLERLDDQTDELEKLEMAINEIGYKISIKPEKQETQKNIE